MRRDEPDPQEAVTLRFTTSRCVNSARSRRLPLPVLPGCPPAEPGAAPGYHAGRSSWSYPAMCPGLLRPSDGAIVYLQKTGRRTIGAGERYGLNSQAVQTSFKANNSYFLPPAFPEGSPTHPAYPTCHGAVTGACITALKFFFDGTFAIENPLVPSSGGTATAAYTAPPGEAPLTVNGTTSASVMASMPGSTGTAIPIRRSSWARRWR